MPQLLACRRIRDTATAAANAADANDAADADDAAAHAADEPGRPAASAAALNDADAAVDAANDDADEHDDVATRCWCNALTTNGTRWRPAAKFRRPALKPHDGRQPRHANGPAAACRPVRQPERPLQRSQKAAAGTTPATATERCGV